MAEGPSKKKNKGKGRGRGRGRGEDPIQDTLHTPGRGIDELDRATASLSVEQPLQLCTKPKYAAAKEEEEEKEDKEVPEGNMKSLIRRPNLGTKGKQIKLIANHFPFTMPKDLVVQHYDMAVFRYATEKDPKTGQVGPETLKEMTKLPKFLFTKIYTDLISLNSDIFPNRHTLAFDGNKNIFSKTKLSINKTGKEFSVVVKNEEKLINDNFIVRVKHVSEIVVDLKRVFDRNLVERKSVATLVLDVILKQTTMFDSYYVPCGRRIFYHPEPRDMYPLGTGIVRYPGFWQSVRPVSGWKVMLNIDQANTAFVKEGSVLNFLRQLNFDDPKQVTERDLSRLAKALEKLVKGVKVTTTQRRDHRTAKCIAVTKQSAAQLKFNVTLKNHSQRDISVAEYFQIMHKEKQFVRLIQYPNLPCLQVGSAQKKNYVPIEFCEVKEGQRYMKKLNDNETSKMLKYASQSAPERMKKIQDDANYMKFDQDPFLKGFGFTVSLKMAEVPGRVLQAPGVAYENQQIQPKEGGWNMRNVKLIEGCKIRDFALITTVTTTDKRTLENFLFEWVKSARGMGFQVHANNACSITQEMSADNIGSHLRDLKAKFKNLDLVFIVLLSQNTDFYGCAKSAGDVQYGINTQCVQLKNVSEPKPAMLANLCLKINGKLGGVNSKLVDQNKSEVKYFLKEPILFLGADVNHPSPTERDEPISCAAVVGNVDLYPSLYSAKISLQRREQVKTVKGKQETQKAPQEWIANMKDAVKMIIERFVERNRLVPSRIIVYRDGVGETMFLQVLTKELTAIRLACEESAQRFPEYVKKCGFKEYNPPITFIVVQKRHHTRLFCANPADEMGRGSNVPPGTTVDTTIVHPEEFDFYLCSHLGIQGTSRPAHYHVLHDDSNFSADDLQTLTYYLCHTYVRATRSVSIPPPCYYADLVAYRARKYLESRMGSSDSASVATSSSRSTMNSLTDLQRYVDVDDTIVKKGMFFV